MYLKTFWYKWHANYNENKIKFTSYWNFTYIFGYPRLMLGGGAGGGLETSSKSKEEIIGHGVNAVNVIQWPFMSDIWEENRAILLLFPEKKTIVIFIPSVPQWNIVWKKNIIIIIMPENGLFISLVQQFII